MGKTTLLTLPHLDTSCVAVGTKRSDAVGFTKKTLQLIALFHMRNQKGVNKDPDGAERGRRGGGKSREMRAPQVPSVPAVLSPTAAIPYSSHSLQQP